MKKTFISAIFLGVLSSALARAEGEQLIFKSAAVPRPELDLVLAVLENRGTIDLECTTTLEVIARNEAADESTLASVPVTRVLRAGRREDHSFNFKGILDDVRQATGDATWKVRAVPPQAYDIQCERAINDEPGGGSPLSEELIVLGTPGALRVFDAGSLAEVTPVTGPAGRVVATVSGTKIAATAGPGFVAIYDLASGASLGQFAGPSIPKAAAFSSDGAHLYVAGGDQCTDDFHCGKGVIAAFAASAAGWTAGARIAAPSMVTDVTSSPLDQRIAASGNGSFSFYDGVLASLGAKGMPGSESGASAVALAGNGKVFVGSGPTIFSCAGACAQVHPVAQITGSVTRIDVDPRTRRAIVAAGTAALTLDTVTGATKALPLKSTERVFNAAHARTADLAVTAGVDYAEGGQLVLETWDLSQARPALRNRKVLGRPDGIWSFGVAFAGGTLR